MVFAALLLLSPLPLIGDVVLPVSSSTSIIAVSTAVNAGKYSSPIPSPELFISNTSNADAAELSALSIPQPKANGAKELPPAELAAQPNAFAFEPVKPVSHPSMDNRIQKKIWYGLLAAGHVGATFDAWSTRRALSGNYGTESDPLMRPFAHSGALYMATQISPALLDFIGRRAMTSEHPWVRRLWWVPQSVGASLSFGAATHNVGVAH